MCAYMRAYMWAYMCAYKRATSRSHGRVQSSAVVVLQWCHRVGGAGVGEWVGGRDVRQRSW